MAEIKLIEILAEEYRHQAEENEWDDIQFLSDEEVAEMNPQGDTDPEIFLYDNVNESYSLEELERILRIEEEINLLAQDIGEIEQLIATGTVSYVDLPEYNSELAVKRARQMNLLKELGEIRTSHEGRARTLR